MRRLIRLADHAGIAVSALCLVHCVATPLLVAAFPLLGQGADHHALHDTLLAGVNLPVLLALVPGYLAHRDRLPLLLGGAGLALFLLAVLVAGPWLGDLAETVLALASSVLLLAAHRRNHAFCKRCG